MKRYKFCITLLSNGLFELTTLVSAYADDLALVCSGRNKDNNIGPRLQPEVDKRARWSSGNRLTLITSKYEDAFFMVENAASTWRPNIRLAGVQLNTNTTPAFLATKYVRQLTVNTHVRCVHKTLQQCANHLLLHLPPLGADNSQNFVLSASQP